MKICIYSANYLPNIGGIEKFTERLSLQLCSMGHQVTIVTNNVFDLPDIEMLDGNIEIYRLPCYPLIGGRFPIPKKNTRYKELINELFRQPVDGVLVNARFYPHSFTGVKHAERYGIKPVLIDHGSAYLTFDNSLLDTFVIAYEHMMTALLKRHQIDYYGISRASLRWLRTFRVNGLGVINNSIDADDYLSKASDRPFVEELGIDSDSLKVCFTGRLIPEKGISELLGAAELLKGDNVEFMIAGDGPLRKTVEGRNLGNVHLLGRLSQEDVAALLKQCDVFCLPTRSEGFSTSLLEAAACYCAPVITNVGGVEEMIPSEEYGVVLSSQSSSLIARTVHDLNTDRGKVCDVSKKIGERVRCLFSWEQTASKVVQAFERAGN